jgi:hypothetical protein
LERFLNRWPLTASCQITLRLLSGGRYIDRTMNKKHLAALATTVLLTISGVAAGGAQAATFDPGGLSLSPVGQFPLTPVSEQNAVRAAQTYLSVAGLSRTGLIKQLVDYDGYSTADATSAVDSITVDWNEQAAKAARNYLSVAALSRSGLINQLTSYDGFTPSQATYGANAVGL